MGSIKNFSPTTLFDTIVKVEKSLSIAFANACVCFNYNIVRISFEEIVFATMQV